MPDLYAKVAVSFPDDPKTVEAGDLAELAYLRCILRGRENLTDGVIDRRVLSRWLVGIRGKPETHMARLVSVGLVVEHPDGWCIPIDAWRKWNPLRSEVEAKRAEDAERKRLQRESKKRPRGHDTESEAGPAPSEAEAEAESKTEAAAGTSERDIDDEVARRVDRRRRDGEDIGPGLVKLIRHDVIRDLALRAEPFDDIPPPCEECRGFFITGVGLAHATDCSVLGLQARELEETA